jgi:hypothetical protein
MTKHSDIAAATAAEIENQKRAFSARRDEITKALADLFKVRGFSIHPAPVSARTELVIGKARQLLNGSANILLDDLKPADCEESLRLELDAIDHILGILAQKQIERVAVEAQMWASDHDAELRALYRDMFLTVCKHRALRAKADDMNSKIFGATVPFGAFFAEWDGWNGSLILLNPGQFETAMREAIAAGIASESEIRKAMKP